MALLNVGHILHEGHFYIEQQLVFWSVVSPVRPWCIGETSGQLLHINIPGCSVSSYLSLAHFIFTLFSSSLPIFAVLFLLYIHNHELQETDPAYIYSDDIYS